MGCLGAAKIAPGALIRPARVLPGVEVRAVAARDRHRAEAFAAKNRVPVVYGSYDELLGDGDISAIYNPLPNGLHAEWTLRALAAGKHVLCEKPFTANAPEAERVAAAAAASGLVVMEAFHWRYHPLARRMVEIIQSGELGVLQRVEAAFCFPLPSRHDIRWQLSLAGGAMMDAGCYAVHMVRTMAGAEPAVTTATARLRSPGVDRYLRAEMEFPDGTTGTGYRVDVVEQRAQALGRRDRRPKDDAGLQPIGAAHLSPPQGRWSPRTRPWRSHLRLPARGIRGRGPDRRAHPHAASGERRQHESH